MAWFQNLPTKNSKNRLILLGSARWFQKWYCFSILSISKELVSEVPGSKPGKWKSAFLMKSQLLPALSSWRSLQKALQWAENAQNQKAIPFLKSARRAENNEPIFRIFR